MIGDRCKWGYSDLHLDSQWWVTPATALTRDPCLEWPGIGKSILHASEDIVKKTGHNITLQIYLMFYFISIILKLLKTRKSFYHCSFFKHYILI